MTISMRHYENTAQDLARIQAALAQWIQRAGAQYYCHVGDVPHRLYNGTRCKYPLDEFVLIWEDDSEIIAFGYALPHWNAFELYVASEHRGGDVELNGLIQLARHTRMLMVQMEKADKPLVADGFTGDTERLRLLEEMDFQAEEHYIGVSTRSLLKAIPNVPLPAGFTLRPVAGEHEIEGVIAVHSGAFNSNWTAEQYLQVMRSPGFHIDREMVVVAPDGRFAAFCIYWLDEVNKMGLFEPVGVHKDFQRQGLARAMMCQVMQVMADKGMTSVMVGYELDNPASSALYRSLGFETLYETITYKKEA